MSILICICSSFLKNPMVLHILHWVTFLNHLVVFQATWCMDKSAQVHCMIGSTRNKSHVPGRQYNGASTGTMWQTTCFHSYICIIDVLHVCTAETLSVETCLAMSYGNWFLGLPVSKHLTYYKETMSPQHVFNLIRINWTKFFNTVLLKSLLVVPILVMLLLSHCLTDN